MAAQWQELLSGLANGPKSMLQKALDVAVAHRQEDVYEYAERVLDGSRYWAEALAGLRNAAVRHRKAPKKGAWKACMTPPARSQPRVEREHGLERPAADVRRAPCSYSFHA